MPIPLEPLGDGSISDRNFQKLMQLVLDPGGQSLGVRLGATVVTWPGGSHNAAAVAVAHSLGRVPIVVLPAAQGSLSAGAAYAVPEAHAYGSGTFTISAATNDGTSPAAGTTATLVWAAVG